MQIFVRHGLSNQISKINERIDELNQNKETYQIESSPSEIWSSSSVEADPDWYVAIQCSFVNFLYYPAFMPYRYTAPSRFKVVTVPFLLSHVPLLLLSTNSSVQMFGTSFQQV